MWCLLLDCYVGLNDLVVLTNEKKKTHPEKYISAYTMSLICFSFKLPLFNICSSLLLLSFTLFSFDCITNNLTGIL